MITFTEEMVLKALLAAKVEQDEIIEKAKEIENGSKTSRTSSLTHA